MEKSILSSQKESLNNNLGGTLSLWMESATVDSPAPLQNDLEVDVCIVGGGIVGLSCGYFLLQNQKSVAILESGSLAGGQTARTTGHLAWALDDRFSELEQLFGLEGARLAADSHYTAVNQIERLIAKEQIDCDFSRLDGYLFVPPGDSLSILNQELAAVQKIGFEVERVNRAPFPSFDTGPCLRFPRQGQFHILKYLKGLTQAILRNGGKIYSHTHVFDIEEGSPCLVKTNQGKSVKAKSVIIATNSPINTRLMIHSKQAPYLTYVIAAPVPKGQIPYALYWDTPDPYHYIRLQTNQQDPNSDWLIIGGEDHKTGQEEESVFSRYTKLEEWSRARFPTMGKIEYAWSGQVLEPIDDLAFIGKSPHSENVYLATGDSGNGLTHGTIAGLLLTDLILGKKNPWAKLYDPARKTAASVIEFVKENLNVLEQYGQWVTPSQVKSPDEIAPDCGAVIRDGLKKLAIYRDQQGEIYTYSAVCPHLGCIVNWNPKEKTWDCPCHGSRFNCYGKVINGPSVRDLKEEKS